MTKTTKCRRCGMPFEWAQDYGRDLTVWAEHVDPLDCIAVLRHELNDERLRAVEVKAEQTRRGVLDHEDRLAMLEARKP